MSVKVLVAYATKYGATAGIADKIATVLREAGLSVDVLRADRVSDLAPYGAVVLGSAVYFGQWRQEAAAFLKANEKVLSERPVWLFSSGPAGGGAVAHSLQGWRLPEALQPIADRIGVRDIVVFDGAIDLTRLNLADRLVIRGLRASPGDNRDWEAITAWAACIAAALK